MSMWTNRLKLLRNMDYGEIIKTAGQENDFTAFLDPDHPGFLNPENMEEAVGNYFQETGQKMPESPFAVVRSCLESLALKYRYVFEQLLQLFPHPVNIVHIIGGGSKNRMLNRFTANALGRKVLAGPAEATSIGNILVQAIKSGRINSLNEARLLVKKSCDIEEYVPEDSEKWDKAYGKFKETLELPG
jgi:rhamnulokinase